MYNWGVDLKTYQHSTEYPNNFDDLIGPKNIMEFENKFYKAISALGGYEVAGEVCYWKNYGTATGRNRITKNLLEHLQLQINWHGFAASVKNVSGYPTYENFLALRKACNQVRGFATPITFISFYNPVLYPMVDKHIADWWKSCKVAFGYKDHPVFSQRKNDGWIQTYSTNDSQQNWAAYLAWKSFCNDYTERIKVAFNIEWRARDVEMAVWMAWKNNVSLDVI